MRALDGFVDDLDHGLGLEAALGLGFLGTGPTNLLKVARVYTDIRGSSMYRFLEMSISPARWRLQRHHLALLVDVCRTDQSHHLFIDGGASWIAEKVARKIVTF